MRIATSTIYDQQTQSIDSLSAQYQTVGQQLSSGKSLNVPSDDPSVVSQDLTLRNTISSENTDASSATAAQNKLTYTDSVLSSLTSVLQTARSLAVEGANAVIPNGSQRPLIGKQVEGLLDQALQLANSQFGQQYLFAGTGPGTTQPVTALGNPPTGISFIGNDQAQTQVINGQTITTGTTLQQAFNYNATDGSPSVFTLLATLRDTLDKETASVQSAAPINATGQTIYGAADATQTTLGQLATPGGPSQTTLTPDSDGFYTITIDGTSPTTSIPGSSTLTFTNATPVDGVNGVVQQINAQTAVTGVTAAWNVQTQRLQLTSTSQSGQGTFNLSDSATPAGNGVPPAAATATNTSNFLTVFQLPNQVTVEENLSTQLGNIDTVTNALLAARAQVGQQINNLQSTTSQLTTESTDNTSIKSGYEDTNVAQATSQFSLIQTALQGAYATTTRLEGLNLMNYLATGSTTG
jgi:flagellar hook-associated protein 3 FlgL